MSTNVTLPALGESVTEGTVSRWLKAVGDRVEADEPLVEVSTDKVDTEIPSPVAGVLLEIKVEEDDVCEVGGLLAVVGDESEAGAGSQGGDAAPATAAAEEEQAAQGESGEPQGMKPDMAAEPKEDATDPTPVDGTEQAAAQPASGALQGTQVTLPALGESVTEGTVSRWLKAVGDEVEADEPLVEVSTDKVDTEIPSPVAGTILEIRVQEDDVCAVGGVLAIVGDALAQSSPSEEAPAPKAEAPKAEAPKPKAQAPKAEAPKPERQADEEPELPNPAKAERSAGENEDKQAAVARRADTSSTEGDELYVTPLVRKMAAEHGVSLKTLVGTGVGGRIRKQDVLAAADAAKAGVKAPAPSPASEAPKPVVTPASQAPAGAAKAAVMPSPEAAAKRGTTEKMTRLRATIAKRMVESLQVSAQLTATVEVDLTTISKLRGQVKETFKKTEGVGLSYLPFVTKVAVETLKAFPALNATIDTEAGTITYNDDENIGIAVDTPKGLLVPVIKNAGDLNIAGLAKQIHDLAGRTRDSKVTPDELTGGTFTITNYGSAGALFDTPIINQPQVAILGTGSIVKRPVVMSDERYGDTIVVRDMMYLSLTYDHRLVDGANAARFLTAMKARLEEGDFSSEFGL